MSGTDKKNAPEGGEKPAGNSTRARELAWRNIQYSTYLIILILISVSGFLMMRLRNENQESKNLSGLIPAATAVSTQLIDGKDAETGLIADEGYIIVKQNCIRCHSSKLIIQNHLSRERWEKAIRWMQKNQNLGDLGENENIILDYLAKNYGPKGQGRRKTLDKQNWYYLK